MVIIANVTDEYLLEANPSEGSVIYEKGYDTSNHQEEILTAMWLNKHFGGNVVLLKESTRQRIKTPDYLWQNKFWEFKNVSSDKFDTVDRRIRKAYEQIREHRGGIVLDFSGSKLSLKKAADYVRRSVETRAHGQIDIIVKKASNFVIIRATKK